MARTKASEVHAILDKDVQSRVTEADITSSGIVDDANALVTQHLGGEGLGSDLLTRIEKLIAADFATLLSPLETSRKMGDRSSQFQRASGSKSEYWLRAERIDPTGILKTIGSDSAKSFGFRTSEGYDDDLNDLGTGS